MSYPSHLNVLHHDWEGEHAWPNPAHVATATVTGFTTLAGSIVRLHATCCDRVRIEVLWDTKTGREVEIPTWT